MRVVVPLLCALLLVPVAGRAAPSEDWFTAPSDSHAVPRRPPADHAALMSSFAPFYRVGPSSIGYSDAVVIDTESTMRQVFSVTAPFQHAEVPLPAGNWTVVSVATEASVDDGPAGMDTVLARLEGHTVTGLMLIRGADRKKPGTLLALPPNRFCDSHDRYATGRLTPARDGHDFCWFVSEETDPNLLWTLPEMPAALRYAVGTLNKTGDRLPHALVGATIFRIENNRWIEITTFSDPSRSGVPDAHGMRRPAAIAMADPAMRAFVDRLVRWTQQRATLIAHLGPSRRSPEEVAAINLEAPQ
ncbi:hypothetical protein NFI95_00445 [Acetobacteraceae bacterium KSS8]|uniref:Uncharacterized protein n=1 Tax=Endosaccharibacter trunci TaxID=2812733 RepID=A0ABT1W4Z2_9PROT|nr:hypothetical protein [Acetobacteraceae bacterium KSS8]